MIEVTLRVVPNHLFECSQFQAPIVSVLTNLTSILRKTPYCRLWWFPHTDRVLVWHARPLPILIPAFSAAAVRALKPSAAASDPTAVAGQHIASRLRSRTLMQRLLDFVRGRLVGYHLLQLLFFFSRFVPGLLKILSGVYLSLVHGARTEYVNSQEALTFDVLFKQYVTGMQCPPEQRFSSVVAAAGM